MKIMIAGHHAWAPRHPTEMYGHDTENNNCTKWTLR